MCRHCGSDFGRGGKLGFAGYGYLAALWREADAKTRGRAVTGPRALCQIGVLARQCERTPKAHANNVRAKSYGRSTCSSRSSSDVAKTSG